MEEIENKINQLDKRIIRLETKLDSHDSWLEELRRDISELKTDTRTFVHDITAALGEVAKSLDTHIIDENKNLDKLKNLIIGSLLTGGATFLVWALPFIIEHFHNNL